MTHSFSQKLGAEFIGTAGLLATVIGSGIMGEALAGGNVAIALLGNTIASGGDNRFRAPRRNFAARFG